MEERQLNFNQPLLSVRRAPSMSALPEVNYRKSHNSKPTLPPLPYYKSDLKSGPVSNPGVVPFQWEQMPGQPKHENLVPKHNIRLPAVAPKLPPGRIANYKQKPIDKTPKDSPSSREGTEKEISSSEDENATFVDAPGTLSRAESFYNCSVSGVSGVDSPSMEGSVNFSDSQTRDFMMGRFLPAAKSMASETPHYASRKNSAAREESKTVKRVIKWKQRSPQYDLPSNLHGSEEDDQEVEGEDEYDGMEDMSAKLCGLLPKFCLLNPLPGMRDNGQAMSSVRSVRTRTAFVESSRKSEKKDRTNGHVGDMKRRPLKSAKNQPSIIENFGSRSITRLKDGSPQLFLDKEKRFPGLLQEIRDLRDNKLDCQTVISLQDAQVTTSPPNPIIEKTFYIDHDQPEQSRNSISSSPESRGRNPSVDSLQDIKSISGNDKQVSHPKSSNTSERSFQDVGEDFQRDHNFNLDAKEGIQESGLLSLGPLLPKSPSESWLARTLPSMPSKNPCSKSYLGNLTFRSSPVDPKRETMLRTSNLQHMVFRPARELGPILEN